jgi:hypothetical protein
LSSRNNDILKKNNDILESGAEEARIAPALEARAGTFPITVGRIVIPVDG